MKDLFSQVFYNMFISQLDTIENELNAHEYQKALLNVFILVQKFTITDWQPFPGYQILVNKLGITSVLSLLHVELSKLNDGETNDPVAALRIINQLKTYAHLLNFIECSYNNSEAVAAEKRNIIMNSASSLGVVFKEIRRTSDCHGTLQFSQVRTASQVTPPTPEEFTTVIRLVNSFDNERLHEFTLTLFNSLERIEKDSAEMQAVKSGERNMFVEGEIESVVSLSNVYKEEFKQKLLALTNQTDGDDRNNCREFCEIATTLLERKFGK